MFSIYVPRVLNEHTFQSIANIMAQFNIGIVHYVDFTPINKKPGFYEYCDAKFKTAFIHFIDVPGYHLNTKFWDTISRDNKYQLQISSQEYWICLKNHSPIQRTLMNIHQVVENSKYLEDRIEMLEDKFEKLEGKMNNIQSDVVAEDVVDMNLPYFDPKFSVKLHTIGFHVGSNTVIKNIVKFLGSNKNNISYNCDDVSNGLFMCKILHKNVTVNMNIQVYKTDVNDVTNVEIFRLSGDRLLFCYLSKELKNLNQIEDIEQIQIKNYSEPTLTGNFTFSY